MTKFFPDECDYCNRRKILLLSTDEYDAYGGKTISKKICLECIRVLPFNLDSTPTKIWKDHK